MLRTMKKYYYRRKCVRPLPHGCKIFHINFARSSLLFSIISKRTREPGTKERDSKSCACKEFDFMHVPFEFEFDSREIFEFLPQPEGTVFLLTQPLGTNCSLWWHRCIRNVRFPESFLLLPFDDLLLRCIRVRVSKCIFMCGIRFRCWEKLLGIYSMSFISNSVLMIKFYCYYRL